MFDSLIQQVSVGDATNLITAFAALAGTGFVTSILTWISHHTGNKTVQDGIAKVESVDSQVQQLSQQVQSHSQQISTAITAATTLSPQLQRLLDEKDAQLKSLANEVNNVKTQLNTIGSVVPADSLQKPLAPASPKPEPHEAV